MTLQAAIQILKQYVKESAVPGQMHISPDLVNAQDLESYEAAMEMAHNAVLKGELSREELLRKLGLQR